MEVFWAAPPPAAPAPAPAFLGAEIKMNKVLLLEQNNVHKKMPDREPNTQSSKKSYVKPSYFFLFLSSIISNKVKSYQEAMFFAIIFTYLKYNIQIQNGHGVLEKLVSCIKDKELACWVLHGHFEYVYLLQVSETGVEKRCFLK